MLDVSGFDEIVSLVKKIMSKKRSPRTLSDYKRAARFLGDMTPQEYREKRSAEGKPLSKSRYHLLKAAYQYDRASTLYAFICSVEKGESCDTSGLGDLAEELFNQKPDYEKKRNLNRSGAAHPAPVDEKPRKKDSKRQYIGKVNKAFPGRLWQNKIIEEMPDKHKLAAYVLAMTGCRPVELEQGVQLRVEGDKLLARIEGAKVTEQSGQPWRELTFDPAKDRFAPILHTGARRFGGTYTVKMACTQHVFQKIHSRAVKRALGPSWIGKVTLYSHRHAMSVAMKADGLSRQDIAAAMGHCSTRSQTSLGMCVQAVGRSGCGFVCVKASREVKSNESVANRMRSRRMI